jgi:hypothetical protein
LASNGSVAAVLEAHDVVVAVVAVRGFRPSENARGFGAFFGNPGGTDAKRRKHRKAG